MYSSSRRNIYIYIFVTFYFSLANNKFCCIIYVCFSWYYFIGDSLVSEKFLNNTRLFVFLKKRSFFLLSIYVFPSLFSAYHHYISKSFSTSLLILNRNINVKMLLLLLFFFKMSLLKIPWFL